MKYIDIPDTYELNRIPFLSKTEQMQIVEWLIDNTTLPIDIIDKLTSLPSLTVQQIFDDKIHTNHLPINPFEKNLLNQKYIDEFLDNPLISLKPIENVNLKRAEIDELLQLDIFSVKLIKIFIIYDGHAAWNYSWSSYYRGLSYLSLQKAKEYPETQRGWYNQGYVYNICERPSLCFYTKEGMFFVTYCTGHQAREFVTLKDFVKQIHAYKTTYYKCARCSENIILDSIIPDTPLYKYISHAVGIDYNLDYEVRTQRKEDFDWPWLMELKNSFIRILKEESKEQSKNKS